MPRFRGLVILASLVILPACNVDAAPKVRQTEEKPTPSSKPAKLQLEVPPTEEEAEAAGAEPAAPAADAVDPAAPLGEQFRDPPWYRKTIFSEAQGKVVSTSRSEADELGRFKSHMVFELSELTGEQCLTHLGDAVKPMVSNLEKTEEADGRLKLSGSTDRYNVTLLCGEAKGTMRAYVAYEWTK